MLKTPIMLVAALVGVATAVAGPAAGHVTLERSEAAPGSGYRAVLRVPHGCERSATIKLRVQIPEGLIAVKPMPKPGWSIAVTRGAYTQPYAFMHGITFSEGVREITWTGRLDDDLYDEFVFSGFLAAALPADTTLVFPTVQECEKGTASWTEVLAPGQDPHALKTPAPSLRLIAPPAADHHGHHWGRDTPMHLSASS